MVHTGTENTGENPQSLGRPHNQARFYPRSSVFSPPGKNPRQKQYNTGDKKKYRNKNRVLSWGEGFDPQAQYRGNEGRNDNRQDAAPVVGINLLCSQKPHKACYKTQEGFSEYQAHHKKGGDMKKNIKKDRDVPDFEELPGNDQMPRTGYGKEFGNPLQKSQKNGFEKCHRQLLGPGYKRGK